MKRTELKGKKFGRLFVVSFYGIDKNKHAKWNCKCSCGKEKIVSATNLLTNKSKSCGCLQKEIVSHKFTTHGLSDTKIYNTWKSMMKRCYNPKSDNYKNYGGRGIKVCNQWKNIVNFLKDMGNRPLLKSIDRINNNGNYEKENCRWATIKEQRQNTTRTKLSKVIAEKIRKLAKRGVKIKIIASKYKVTGRNIYDVINNKIWTTED